MSQASKLETRAYTLTAADTLYRIDLPPGTSRLHVQSRVKAQVIKLRFDTYGAAPAMAPEVTGQNAYWTLAGDPGQYVECKVTGGGPRTLYAESATAGAVIEILLGV